MLYICPLNHRFFKKISVFSLNFSFSFPRRIGKTRDSDEENDPDDEDAVANAVGCLGPFSGLLAPELQKYQKQMKGNEVAPYFDMHSVLDFSSRSVVIILLMPIS